MGYGLTGADELIHRFHGFAQINDDGGGCSLH